MQINLPHSLSVRDILHKFFSTNNWEAWLAPASCRGFFSWMSAIRVEWLISSSLRGPFPQVLTLLGGVRFIAWRLRRPSSGKCRLGPRYFWSRWARVGSCPAPGPTLKTPCATLARLVGRSTNTAWLDTALCRGFFSWVSGIHVGWLISSSLRGQSPQVLTLMGGVWFIALRWRRRRGPRHFWCRRTRVGIGLAPGPT